MGSTGGGQRLSVVLAAVGDCAGREILSGLAPQLSTGDEVILVGGAEPDREARGELQSLRWLRAEPDATTPARWAAGLAAAAGDLVVTSTVHFEPATDWLAAFRRAHSERRWAGVGGAIDPPRRNGALALAVWALRYSGAVAEPEPRPVSDLAADNACYRRSVLDRHRDVWRNGFWEPEVHERMLAEGERLLFDPSARLVMRPSFGAAEFSRQRMVHGRRYGSWRARRWSLPTRCARVAGAPLVPPLLAVRAMRRSRRHGVGARRLAAAAPWIALFAAAWALGEARGALGPGGPAVSLRRG